MPNRPEPRPVGTHRFAHLDLDDLDTVDAGALLTREGVTSRVAKRCHTLVGGNPLALLEAARTLTADQRSGRADVPDVFPLGDRLSSVFADRLSALPAPSRTALEVAALESGDELAVIVAATEALGGRLGDFLAAEQAGLIALGDGRVAWQHPLLRSAVNELCRGEVRRVAHRALAEVLSRSGRVESELWHRSESTLSTDDALSDRFEAAADAALDAVPPALAPTRSETPPGCQPPLTAALASCSVAGKPTSPRASSTPWSIGWRVSSTRRWILR